MTLKIPGRPILRTGLPDSGRRHPPGLHRGRRTPFKAGAPRHNVLGSQILSRKHSSSQARPLSALVVLLHTNAASPSDAIVCSFAITNTSRDVVRPNEGNASLRPAQRAGPV